MRKKAGEKKTRGAIIAAIAAFIWAGILVLPSVGVELPFKETILFLFSFSTNDNPLWLLPAAAFFLIASIMLIVNRKRPIVLTFQLFYSALITYTLHSLSHILQESPWPIFRTYLIKRSEGVRSASFTLLLLFIGEILLLIIIVLISDAVRHRRRPRIEEERVEEPEETETVTFMPKPTAEFPNVNDLPEYVDRTP
ncbi:MAG TPA: hypothetical protein PLW47_04885, partial [Sphaerochaeta sp.]|nr:hypothetical protein [Sphaerochaeta sp.]